MISTLDDFKDYNPIDEAENILRKLA